MVLTDPTTRCTVCGKPCGEEPLFIGHSILSYPRGHRLEHFNQILAHYDCAATLSDFPSVARQFVLNTLGSEEWPVVYLDEFCCATTNPIVRVISLKCFDTAAEIRIDYNSYPIDAFDANIYSLAASQRKAISQAAERLKKAFPNLDHLLRNVNWQKLRRNRVNRRLRERTELHLKRREIADYNRVIERVLTMADSGLFSCPNCGRSDKLYSKAGSRDQKGYAMCLACGSSMFSYFKSASKSV